MSNELTERQLTRVRKAFENRRNRAKMKEIRRTRRLEKESRRRRGPGSRRVHEDVLDDLTQTGAGEGDEPDEEGDPHG